MCTTSEKALRSENVALREFINNIRALAVKHAKTLDDNWGCGDESMDVVSYIDDEWPDVGDRFLFTSKSTGYCVDALSFVIICARTVEDAQRILDERYTEGGWEAPTNIGKAGKSVNNGIIEEVWS